jgi:hypothetical protein
VFKKEGTVDSFFFARDMARIGLLIVIVVGVIVETPLLVGPCAHSGESLKEARVVAISLAVIIVAALYAFTRVRSQARVEQMIRTLALRSGGTFDIDSAAATIGIPATHIRFVVVSMGQKGTVKPVDPLENPPERFRIV